MTYQEDALTDRVPIDAGTIEPAQIDHLGIRRAEGVDCVENVVDHREVTDDRQLRTDPADRRLANRYAVVEIGHRSDARRRIQVDVLHYEYRVLAQQGAVHQSDVVERIRRRDDPPAGCGGKDAGRIHRVLRPIPGTHRDLGAQHERNVVVAAEHVPGFTNLVEQLIGSDPHEVGVHEFDDRFESAI
jgi:hypothetical protein